MSLQNPLNFSSVLITPLCADDEVKKFRCSNDDLNDYLYHDALRDQQESYSITHIVKYEGEIIGFFTLITDTLHITHVNKEVFLDYEYEKVPGIKIARLATDQRYEGRHIGRFMLIHIFKIVYELSLKVGCRVITVNAKLNAVDFYRKYAFKEAKLTERNNARLMYIDVKVLIGSAETCS